MAETYRSVCPLNCPDTCALKVTVEGGRVAKVEGDPFHPITKGFICSKGQGLKERIESPDRVTVPLIKEGGRWRKAGWDEALDLVAHKLAEARQDFGPQAVLHLFDYANGGVLKNLDRRFFNLFGGATVPGGSLCWGSGTTAQQLDFGMYGAHDWEDLLNSKVILLWGRDPAQTSIHLIPYLKAAQEEGAKIYVINPIRTRSADLFDGHIAPRPGTDGALALGLAYVILEERLLDVEFVHNHVHGFAEYAAMVREYPPERVEGITGVGRKAIRELAHLYAKAKPAAILLGYGLQRYKNGGQTIRAIDALGAITGNIGVSGGGVSYGNQWNGLAVADVPGNALTRNRRVFPWPTMAESILQAQDPPIRCLVVSRANPVTQMPDTHKTLEAFRAVPFKVVIDAFLTDTAEEADVFLPCALPFEEEDVVSGAWNPFLFYAPPLVAPRGEARPDREIFGELAKRLGIGEQWKETAEEWLRWALEPCKERGVALESLKERPRRNPYSPRVPWYEKNFATPSGKIELYSDRAASLGLDPVPRFHPPEADGEAYLGYPYHLLTIHPRKALHSQFQNLMDDEAETFPVLGLHPETAEKLYLREGDGVTVETPFGHLRCQVTHSTRTRPDTVVLEEGSWIKFGGGVNFLTPAQSPDLGQGVPYYDVRCRLLKFHRD